METIKDNLKDNPKYNIAIFNIGNIAEGTKNNPKYNIK